MHPSFVTTVPQEPGISGGIKFSRCKAPEKCRVSSVLCQFSLIPVKSPAQIPAGKCIHSAWRLKGPAVSRHCKGDGEVKTPHLQVTGAY